MAEGQTYESSASDKHLTSLGKKIRQARQERGMTLKEVADALGYTPSHISQIERGLTNPSVSSLLGIAGVLGLPIEYFFKSSDGEATAEKEVSSELEGGPAAVVTARGPRYLEGNGGVPASRQAARDLSPVVRAGERETIEVLGGIEWQRLTPAFDQTIEFLEIRYDVGGSSGDMLYTHRGREYGVVLQGRLKIELGFSTYILEEGDSVSFDCSTPHRLSNAGDEVMRGIWVIIDRC